MAAFGAKFVLTPKPKGMEGARDIAGNMQTRGEGVILDQFANGDNPLAHYDNTGREIWEQTKGRITHFVSSMGTTGTIMGVSKYLKAKTLRLKSLGANRLMVPKFLESENGQRRIYRKYLSLIV